MAKKKGKAGRPIVGRFPATVRDAILDKYKVHPLTHMMDVLNDTAKRKSPMAEAAHQERRDKMAAMAAPYLHPRLAQTEIAAAPDPENNGERVLKVKFV